MLAAAEFAFFCDIYFFCPWKLFNFTALVPTSDESLEPSIKLAYLNVFQEY